jgi:hypothetical protein
MTSRSLFLALSLSNCIVCENNIFFHVICSSWSQDFLSLIILQAFAREAREYELGQATYFGTLVASAVLWQLFFLGTIGVSSLGSALLSGIIIATLLPVTESLAVLFFHERFHVEKGISLTLSLWGFVSYFYGALQGIKKNNQLTQEQESSTFDRVN